MIEHVESISTKLNAELFLHREGFLQREVGIVDSRTAQIAEGRAETDGADRRSGKGGWVNPVVRAIAGALQRIADHLNARRFGVRTGEILVSDAGNTEVHAIRVSALEE